MPLCDKEISADCIMLFSAFILLAAAVAVQGSPVEPGARSDCVLEHAMVVTQLPAGAASEKQGPPADGMLHADYGDGARLIIVKPDLSTKIVSQGFHSASDPEISFDGSCIVFAGKRKASDNWNIFEMDIDGSNLRQVTSGQGNFRSPGYQSSLYTLKPIGVPSEPEYHLTFVACTGAMNECGGSPATSLYACNLDGSAVRRLTYNLSSDMDPFIQSDGRLLFAGWQRSGLNHGPLGRVALFGVNIDGTDFAAFSTDEGKRIKHMPCTTSKGLAVFVEADTLPWDGAGTLGSVRLRRPLHSYRSVTREGDGLFHSPSPLPDGAILVSRRNGSDTHAVGRLDPSTGRFELVFDDPAYHDIQAKSIYARPEPDGRSSVVNIENPNGWLYCLDVGLSDLKLPKGTVQRLRVVEGIPPAPPSDALQSKTAIPPLAQRRILGEIDIKPDGSFNVEIPANTPIELQTLDADGMALRKCAWIWARNREPRGCIGCHEDGELTPKNLLVQAVTHPSVKLTLPPERRRTVDFRRDIMPIVAGKCAGCHNRPGASLRLAPEASATTSGVNSLPNGAYANLSAPADKPGRGKYVHPGQARTSPLIWNIFGRNTSRSWDGDASQSPLIRKMPPSQAAALTEGEKRAFVEWIDLGAAWENILRPEHLIPEKDKVGGNTK
ncbi:MAG: hypothetical protein JXN61_00875 [Sedimentisphaerales bacterium]|nr:hypothetical protein [Sedimentisphaerales bacterium]